MDKSFDEDDFLQEENKMMSEQEEEHNAQHKATLNIDGVYSSSIDW